METALPKAMEQALYGQPRSAKESIAEFLVRFERSQALLKEEGVELPTKAVGYLLVKQANLDSELEGRLITWLAGDYSRDTVTANLRRLERVTAESSSKRSSYWAADEPEEEEWDDENEFYPAFQLDSQEGEGEEDQYVYAPEGLTRSWKRTM